MFTKTIISALILSNALFATASSAMPIEGSDSGPLLTKSITGGFCDQACTQKYLTIYRDGRVKKVTVYPGKSGNLLEILEPFETKAMNKIVAMVDSLQPKELIDIDKDSPYCADTSNVEYSAVVQYDIMMEVGKVSDCHTYVLSSKGEKLIKIINEAGKRKMIATS